MSTRPMHACLQPQRGAALLLAMLVVTLVAAFAAAAVWQQWRGTEIETAERARLQSDWILAGAGDWARLILMEDARQGGADHLSEPWAVPLMEARLSTFLAAERNITTDADNLPQDAFLSGRIEDMQGRFNLTNLVNNNQLSTPDMQTLQRLFSALQIPAAQATQLADQWLRSYKAQASPGSDSAAPFLPSRIHQLGWLGLSAQTVSRLQPYATILPERTSINANTASVEVLGAAMIGLPHADAMRIVGQRNHQPFLDTAALRQAIPLQTDQPEFGISSRYFMVLGSLRLGSITLQQQSLLQRSGLQHKWLWRERGSFVESPSSVAGTPVIR